jgi:carbamoyl-phosphate synthase (ammonia)
MSGYSFGAEKEVDGEVVFSTGMVSYPEALTDPSFRGQILVLTFPLIGNYGVPDRKEKDSYGLSKNFESDRIWVEGLICQDYSQQYSHWNAASSLGDWLKESGVPGLHGIDTRLLTKKIRDRGAILGKIILDDKTVLAKSKTFADPNKRNLVDEVSKKTIRIYGSTNKPAPANTPLSQRKPRVLAVDCGMKNNMIRMLADRGAEVKVVPWDHDISKERDWYDGLFISNGPGDPANCVSLIKQLRGAINHSDGKDKPIFGICLGNQLLGLAAGADSYKLPFGNRGQNQPVINLVTKHAFITPQNHGFAIDAAKLPDEWLPLFENVNDGSNEGIMHKTKPYFTAQFHPEHLGGPVDTTFLFDMFLETIKTGSKTPVQVLKRAEQLPRETVKKVLVLGSGGLSIGQAGEFDYSGSQAIKALKEQGIKTVLMNPNIASVQTNVDDRALAKADSVYFLPVTPEYIEMVIKRERPDGILVSMGGQTALNCGVELHNAGTLKKYGVKVLGTQIDAIVATEDRQIFNDKLNEIKEKLAPSFAVENLEDAIIAAQKIKYPVMVRAAFALGGLGSGICEDEAKLRDMVTKAFSLTNQVLVEKSLKGWKEVEYEVVRDAADNCLTVCNMENFDPLGIHTGDSIVIAPSQTLSNEEYHMLRNTAIKVVRHVGIVGECNIQYALDPHSTDYCIIEVNARLSRSSALASKATGYPLAAVAAKLSLGITLPEIQNAVTRKTTACFEPSLDYVVTKIPRWDLTKFQGVSTEIGSAMKSVGEVMAIGRGFEESFQKALRMVDSQNEGFEDRHKTFGTNVWPNQAELIKELQRPSDRRPFALAYALDKGVYSIEQLHEITAIDRWFLYRLGRIDQASKVLKGLKSLSEMTVERLRLSKMLGFSDKQIASRISVAKGAKPVTQDDVRALRKQHGVIPFVKQIDTLAAEYPAQTNYLYMTYLASENDVTFTDHGYMVLGSGCYRIGSSVEFDWCAVSAIRTLRKLGKKTVVVNFNPETVSTDFDECDRLYFEELSLERVLDIYDIEGAKGVMVSFGGQIPNNLALPLHKRGVNVMGTSADSIDSSEDRGRFGKLMDSLGIRQPAWRTLTSMQDAFDFSARVGYPVLVRPSYVLSGAAMAVAFTETALKTMLESAVSVSPEHPVVITKFEEGAQEIEFDGVAQKGEIVAVAVCEHVEEAGVHSGDATLLLPPQSVSPYYVSQVKTIAAKTAKALNISGPFNMQFLAKNGDVSVIECNLRASRSLPFVSKSVNCDFVQASTMIMLGEDLKNDKTLSLPGLESAPRPTNFVGVKAPMFSFTRLRGADPVLGVEMASTGEVACFGANKYEAFLKSLVASNFKLPKAGGSVLISAQAQFRPELVHSAYLLNRLGFQLLATPATHDFLLSRGITTTKIDYSNGLVEVKKNRLDLVLCLTNPQNPEDRDDNFIIRRASVDHAVPLMTNPKLVKMLCESLDEHARTNMIGLRPSALADWYLAERGVPKPTLLDAEPWSKENEFH